LRTIVLEKLEVLFLEIGDGLPSLVGNYSPHLDQIGFESNFVLLCLSLLSLGSCAVSSHRAGNEQSDEQVSE